MLLEKIEALKGQLAELKAENEEALETLRIKYLSKKGEITALFAEFKDVPADQKRELGQKLNEIKTLATDRINALRESFQAQAKESNKNKKDSCKREGCRNSTRIISAVC